MEPDDYTEEEEWEQVGEEQVVEPWGRSTAADREQRRVALALRRGRVREAAAQQFAGGRWLVSYPRHAGRVRPLPPASRLWPAGRQPEVAQPLRITAPPIGVDVPSIWDRRTRSASMSPGLLDPDWVPRSQRNTRSATF